MSQRKTAEEILLNGIENYNKRVSDPYKFMLDKDEERVFANCMEEFAQQEVEARDELIKEMDEGLKEAYQQISYLHDKFQETGTGNSVLSRIDTLLSKKAQSFK